MPAETKQHGESKSKVPGCMTWRFSVKPRASKHSVALVSKPDRINDHNEDVNGERIDPKYPNTGTNDEPGALTHATPEFRGITASLDPFCTFPYFLSREDRHLLHFYLLQVPAQVYGTRLDAVFSSVRDGTFPMSATSSWTLQWVLVAAIGIFANEPHIYGLENSLLQRKTQAYQDLNGCLLKNSGVIPDDLLAGVIMATITESRLCDTPASRIHFYGFEAAIRTRGGLRESLARSSSSSLKIAHIMPYLVCEPMGSKGESDAAQQVLDFVQFFKAQVPESSLSRLQAHSPTGFSDGRCLSLIGAVFSFGPLAFYVNPTESPIDCYIDESSYFLSLYLINITLRRADGSGQDAASFISRLVAILHQSSALDSSTGQLLLTIQGFLWVTFKAVKDYRESQCNFGCDNDVQLIMDCLDALKMFQNITSPEARNQIRFLLYYALSGQSF